jgi:putative oxidoreductase
MAEKNPDNVAPLFLRLIIGFGAMQHGWAKLSRGPAGFEKLLIYLNIPFHHLASLTVPYIELLCGLAILLGVFTRWVPIPLICTMLVAMFTIHINYGFSSIKTIGLTVDGPLFGPPGYEVNLLYIAGLISLMLTGAGVLSVDNYRNKKTISDWPL